MFPEHEPEAVELDGRLQPLLFDGAKGEKSSFFPRLLKTFGTKFVILLVVVYFGLKGFVFSFMMTFMLPFYKSFNVEGSEYQLFSALAMIPWSIKPMIGFVSDLYPLFGYHKRSYCCLGCMIGVVCSILICILDFNEDNIHFCVLLFFGVSTELAICDLLVEAKYTAIMREHPETKSDVVTFTWMANTFGGLSATFAVGFNADRVLNIQPYFCATIFFQIIVIPLFIYGFLPEEFIPIGERRFMWEKYNEQKNLFRLAILFSILAIALVFVELFLDRLVGVFYTGIVFIIICSYFTIALPKVLSRFLIYSFLHSALMLNLSGALSYFYIAEPSCVEDAPHFNYKFYQVTAGFVGTVGTLIGLWLYQNWISNWQTQRQLWIPLFVLLLSSFFDLSLLQRWNEQWGISDKVFYLFGDGVIQSILAMLVFMPGMLLISKFCPPRFEGTVFAISASTSNFGGAVASVWGSFLIEKTGIHTSEPCDFTNLTYLLIVARMVVPLFLLPLTCVLMPNLEHDEFVNFNDADPVENQEELSDAPADDSLTHD